LNDRIKVLRNGQYPDVLIGRQALMNCVPSPDGKGPPPGCNGGDAYMVHKYLHDQTNRGVRIVSPRGNYNSSYGLHLNSTNCEQVNAGIKENRKTKTTDRKLLYSKLPPNYFLTKSSSSPEALALLTACSCALLCCSFRKGAASRF